MRGVVAFVLTPAEGHLHWSAPLQQRFGKTTAPTSLQAWFSDAPAEANNIRHAVAQAHEQGNAQFAATIGTHRLRFDVSAVHGPHGTQVVGMALDLSHPTQDVLPQAVQAQRMASLGRLTGGLAHDLNNALTAIIGFAEMALSEARGALKHDLESILSAATRAATTWRHVNAYSRPTSNEVAEVRPNDVVARVQLMLEPLLPPSVVLHTALSGHAGSVEIKPGTLEQVMVALVTNAADAMQTGGRIDISTSPLQLSSTRNLGFEPIPPGHYVQIEVADQGAGIPTEILRSVFEPFYTTRTDGMGMGLTTVLGIVKRGGGYLGVQTEVGRGSRFQVVLPELTAPA